MLITVEVIPHNQQRYDTVGDWQFTPNNDLKIFISDTARYYGYLIAIHEMVEAILCLHSGIIGDTVDKWDLDHINSEEPGEIKGCPYYKQHFIATTVEMILAQCLKINWQEYGKAIKEIK